MGRNFEPNIMDIAFTRHLSRIPMVGETIFVREDNMNYRVQEVRTALHKEDTIEDPYSPGTMIESPEQTFVILEEIRSY